MFNWCPPRPLGPFLQSCFPAGQPSAYTGAEGCSSPEAGFCTRTTSPCSTSWGPCQPISPACRGPSGWQHDPLACQPLLPVLCHPAEDALCPIIQIINEDIKEDQAQFSPLGYTANSWPPTRPCAIDHHPLSPAIQIAFSPPHCLLIQPILHQQWGCLRDSAKSLTEVKVGHIHCSPLI